MSHINWTKWSSIAEIVSSIAILFTLAFLALEIGQSRIATQAQTRSAITASIIELTRVSSQSPVAMTIYAKRERNEELTPEQEMWLRGNSRVGFRHWENVHFQYRAGLFDEQEMETYRTFWRDGPRCDADQKEFWQDSKLQFDPDFRAEMDFILSVSDEC